MNQLYATGATYTYALLRIITGACFALHGAGKVFGFLGTQISFADKPQLFVGGVIELVGGILIAIGLGTRIAAFVSSGTMAVAYIQFHWQLAMSEWKWLPTVNQGELSVVYCFVFLLFFFSGAGALSIDNARKQA